MMGKHGGVVEQDLHDGAQAEAHLVQLAQALGKERPVAFHPFAQQAQEIEGDLGEGKDVGVGGELGRGKAFQPDVGFEFGMKLLAGGVGVVEIEHLLHRQIQGAPQAFQRVLRREQELFAVSCAPGDQRDAAHRVAGGKAVALVNEGGVIPRSRSEVFLVLAQGTPDFPGVFMAWVSADDEVGLLVQAGLQGLIAVMGRVHARQQRNIGEPPCRGDGGFEKRNEFLLRMLGAGPQLLGDHVALLSQVGEKRMIAVEPLIGVGHALALGARVVHGAGVEVQRYEALFMG